MSKVYKSHKKKRGGVKPSQVLPKKHSRIIQEPLKNLPPEITPGYSKFTRNSPIQEPPDTSQEPLKNLPEISFWAFCTFTMGILRSF